MLMDAVFGPKNFVNEIIWHYRTSSGSPKKWAIRNHDVLLRYAKDAKVVKWNAPREPWPESTLRKWQKDDEGRIYRVQNKFKKRYYIDLRGKLMDDVWEITLASRSHERIGYPTQKPEALLDRVIEASTDPGDVVLDPFCGCGTTVASAQRLDRRWIGIDITTKAIDEIVGRLEKVKEPGDFPYEIHYEPVSYEDAQRLADLPDKSKFERWAVRRVGGVHSGKRGADQGIDGRIYFHDEPEGETKQVIISVKAGATGPRHVRELDSVMRREKADLGLLVTMKEPTLAMRREASEMGTYFSVYWDERYPKVQLLTVKQLLSGRMAEHPRADRVPGLWRLAQAGGDVPAEPQMTGAEQAGERVPPSKG
jgi:site-specific DNA-methyltransferase (adenine-specific)